MKVDQIGKEYEILSESTAKIYGDTNLSQLVFDLAKDNCELFASESKNVSLENYFINLLGGSENE